MSRVLLSPTILIAITCAGCGSGAGDDEKGASDEAKSRPSGPPPTLVRIASVKQHTISAKVTVVGSVVPVRESIVASGANGVVASFPIKEGDFVELGTPLCVLRMVTTDLEISQARAEETERKHRWNELKESRPEEVAEAEAKMKAAEARKKQAERKYQTALELVKANAAGQSDITDVVAMRETTAQDYLAAIQTYKLMLAGPRQEIVDQAEARYEAQKSQLEYLLAEKGKRTTKAPFAGYIAREQTEVGQWLSKGDPVLTLIRLDEVDVVVNVDQWQLQNVQLGQTAEVTIGGVQPDKWEGKIVSIVPQSEWRTGSRGFPVKVRLNNIFRDRDGTKVPLLHEGMMASVTFRGTSKSTPMIPKDALVRTNRGTFIHLFKPADGQLDSDKPTPGSTLQLSVEPGISDGEWIEVTPVATDGVASIEMAVGQHVVTEGGERLRPVQENVLGQQ